MIALNRRGGSSINSGHNPINARLIKPLKSLYCSSTLFCGVTARFGLLACGGTLAVPGAVWFDGATEEDTAFATDISGACCCVGGVEGGGSAEGGGGGVAVEENGFRPILITACFGGKSLKSLCVFQKNGDQ